MSHLTTFETITADALDHITGGQAACVTNDRYDGCSGMQESSPPRTIAPTAPVPRATATPSFSTTPGDGRSRVCAVNDRPGGCSGMQEQFR